MFIENNIKDLVYMTSDLIPSTHAFTTRLGGVSSGVYSSLNLGQNTGDKPSRVRSNYFCICSALGIGTDKLVFSRQVHEANVRIVSSADRCELFAPVPYEADGLVTNEPGIALVIFTADCVPVLLSDPDSSVIGAVHCGWRSSCADILGNAIGKMTELGAAAKNIRAAIGPAIDSCCFETGGDVPEAIRNWLGDGAEQFYSNREGIPGKYLCDLKSANRERLLLLGLRDENIDISGDCTMCKSELYWSHRVTGGVRGSMASIITI